MSTANFVPGQQEAIKVEFRQCMPDEEQILGRYLRLAAVSRAQARGTLDEALLGRDELLVHRPMLVFAHNVPVGVLDVAQRPRHWRLITLFLDGAFRGKRLGASSLLALQAQAQSARADISVIVRKNSFAISFFKRNGFIIATTTDDECLLKWRCNAT